MSYTKRKSPHLINLTNLTKKSPSRPIPGFLSFRSDIFSYLYGTFLTLYSMFSMKKSLSLLRLLTAAILLSASGGCSETNDPDPEGGGDPPVKEPVTYTITLGETSEQGAAVKVTPSDETATYYCGIHSEASLLGIPTATLLRQIASLDDRLSPSRSRRRASTTRSSTSRRWRPKSPTSPR